MTQETEWIHMDRKAAEVIILVKESIRKQEHHKAIEAVETNRLVRENIRIRDLQKDRMVKIDRQEQMVNSSLLGKRRNLASKTARLHASE
jgi:hypothetical protein